MFAAKITATSKTLPPPLARVYLPTFSMLLLFTSTYATEVGPCFAAAGAAAAPVVAVAPKARAAMAESASAAVRILLRTGVNIVDRSPIAWSGARPVRERRESPPDLSVPVTEPPEPCGNHDSHARTSSKPEVPLLADRTSDRCQPSLFCANQESSSQLP